MMCPLRPTDPQPPFIYVAADCLQLIQVQPQSPPRIQEPPKKPFVAEDLLREEDDPIRIQNRKILNDMAKAGETEILIGNKMYKWIDILPRISPGVQDSPVRIAQDYMPMPCDPQHPAVACGVSFYTKLNCVPKGIFGGMFSNTHHCVKRLGAEGDACKRYGTPSKCDYSLHCVRMDRTLTSRLKGAFDLKSMGYVCLADPSNSKETKELINLNKQSIANQGIVYGVREAGPRDPRDDEMSS